MILGKTVATAGAPDESPDYWITYSDLLVSLLMVFALLLVLTLTKMQQQVVDARKTIAANQRALALAADSVGNRLPGVAFDPKTQTVSINSEVLFGYGSAEVKPEAESIVVKLATEYLPLLLSDTATMGRIQEILIEGHTDTVGTFVSNLDLSQRRAYSVMRTMVEATYGQSYAEKLRTLMTASGRSESEPAKSADGIYDAARSRRIVVRIRFRDDEILKRLLGDSLSGAL